MAAEGRCNTCITRRFLGVYLFVVGKSQTKATGETFTRTISGTITQAVVLQLSLFAQATKTERREESSKRGKTENPPECKKGGNKPCFLVNTL